MENFLERIQKNIKEFPDYIILCDESNKKGLTYLQIGIIAGRVRTYLKRKNIGKEDFVMICLPRGVMPIIAELGVWCAGAAFVLVEDTYAPERIEYIKNDCGCKLVIDSDVWSEIQQCEPTMGYEPFDEKAAAFAVYTSGTTGNPKGVIHEYGNIDRMVDTVDMRTCEPLAGREDRFALVAPLNFVASLLITVYVLYYVVRMYVVAYSVVKNPLKIGMFFMTNKITGTFLTPTYIRKLTSKPPSLKFCIIGSEPANGVFLEGMKIHNFYLMSESGFAVTHFLIDKRYEKTPVGINEAGYEVMLLDEQGNPVKDGEEGEICFENPYVRGYINLPEQTAEVFKDGIYHSGDLAYRDEEGRLVICGRLNDMVKINGNRVEPGEIEGVAKKVMGVDWTACRIIDNGKKVFICVYYLEDKEFVFEKTRKAMERYLPYYMLPSFFIHIDEIPLRPTGKMDRKALPTPDFSSYQDNYAEPTNDVEKVLCNAFEKVLEIDRVGINDDFYLLGGDSLASMQVLVESKLPGLTAADIFAYHTPKKISDAYLQSHPDGVNTTSDEERDEQARAHKQPLTPMQHYMFDYQLYTPKSTMLNLFSMIKFDTEIFEINRMLKAVDTAISNHPSLMSLINFDEDGELVQEFHREYLDLELEIMPISELQLDTLKDGLVAPFNMINSPLARVYVFQTEKAGYIFFDVHHIVFDGTSSKVLMGDIIKAYYDEPLERDYYYLSVRDFEKGTSSKRYLEDKEYFESLYDGKDYVGKPDTDHDVRENTLDHVKCPIGDYNDALLDIENKYDITRNGFFGLVSMISTAIYNGDNDIMISWTYNGRDDIKKMNETGLLIRDLPLAMSFDKNQKLADIYKDIQSQINGGIAHSSYPYTMIDSQCVKDDMVCFLYQEDLRDGSSVPGIEMVDIRQNNAAAENVLDVQVLDGKDGLILLMDYCSSLYDKESMEEYSSIFLATVDSLCELHSDEEVTFKDLKKAIKKKIAPRNPLLKWFSL